MQNNESVEVHVEIGNRFVCLTKADTFNCIYVGDVATNRTTDAQMFFETNDLQWYLINQFKFTERQVQMILGAWE